LDQGFTRAVHAIDALTGLLKQFDSMVRQIGSLNRFELQAAKNSPWKQRNSHASLA
jgi:hypothetical protein